MRFILVVDRKHLFPGLSPQGFLAAGSIDLPEMESRAFFAERDFMEQCSHYKQIIPYMVLRLGDEILCYQRKTRHTEARLGGLWTVGFGGHIEPLDRHDDRIRELGLLKVAALRELSEETGLEVDSAALEPLGFINSEATEVSTVHFGILFQVDLADLKMSREEITASVDAQAEPHQVAWRSLSSLKDGPDGIGPAPENGEWEDWANLSLKAIV